MNAERKLKLRQLIDGLKTEEQLLKAERLLTELSAEPTDKRCCKQTGGLFTEWVTVKQNVQIRR